MPEFLELMPPLEALETFFSNLKIEPRVETISSDQALGRVSHEPVVAPYPLPSFPRSTVDGYAVQAKDTFGATESLPAYLELKGEIPMGSTPDFSIAPGQCAVIHTGGMLPEGANAVVMVEYTQSARSGEVEIGRAVGTGENIIEVGEDVGEGEEVIPVGTLVGPAEIGGMMALGHTQVRVAVKPRVGIISSGDEVVPPEREISLGQVRDVNSYTLAALVERAGGIPALYGIVADDAEEMQNVVASALEKDDLVVITAGSSASARDLTSIVVDRLGEPGVLVHGVNVRPGKPTILAVCDGKPVIGLPGNPVSALVIAGLFVAPILERYLGLKRSRSQPSVMARLTLNIASQAGREDWVAVRLEEGGDGFTADPIFGRSNLIFTLVRADGLIRIPADANGLSVGTEVEVFLS